MTLPPQPPTIAYATEGDEQPLLLALPQQQKVVLVMDLVESVRLMAANEVAVIDHWRGFVQHATGSVLPRHGGRMVKSLGDGIMAEFDSAREATSAAMALQRYFDGANKSLPPDQHLYLRAGLNATHVYVDDIDIYGSGVNLAARVASLAGPGEVMVTAEVRDGLTDGLDAVVEDMGECYLKHVKEPVRAYRVGAAGPSPILVPEREYASSMEPTVAVVPFASRAADPATFAIGDLIADGLIAQLGRSGQMKVISRQSTAAFRSWEGTSQDAMTRLGSNYLLQGSYVEAEGRLLVQAELVRDADAEVVWVERLRTDVHDLFELESETCQRIAQAAQLAIVGSEVKRALTRPIPTLASYTLLLSGINLMHRTTRDQFSKAEALFASLASRHPRNVNPHAWMAQYHVLLATQGWAADPKVAAAHALECSQRALDLDPNSSLALSMAGLVNCNLHRDFDAAGALYERALSVNPNEPFAHLFRALLHAFLGEGAPAIGLLSRAQALSPLDPLRYYFDAIAASVYLTAEDYPRAIQAATSSLRLNSQHLSSHRVLTMSLALSGQVEAARACAEKVLTLDPAFTVSRFMANTPGRDFGVSKRLAEGLLVAGIPA